MHAESVWPEFMTGLHYGYMAMDGTSTFTATTGSTLPWLSPRRADGRREASASPSASRSALAPTRNQARYLLRDALVRSRAPARLQQAWAELERTPGAIPAAGSHS